VFFYLTYEGAVDIDSITDLVRPAAPASALHLGCFRVADKLLAPWSDITPHLLVHWLKASNAVQSNQWETDFRKLETE